MSAAGEIISALMASGMDPAAAAELVARAAVEMTAAKKTSGAARTQRWRERHKASQCDGASSSSESVTKRHKASQSVTCDNTPLSSSILNNRKRGDRLSPDWSPSDDERSFARQLGWSESQIDSEAANFRDYWIAKPGSGGVKLDWTATWRKWVRSSKVKPIGTHGSGVPITQDWQSAASSWLKFRRWPRGHGPDPDSPACQCPREFLDRCGTA